MDCHNYLVSTEAEILRYFPSSPLPKGERKGEKIYASVLSDKGLPINKLDISGVIPVGAVAPTCWATTRDCLYQNGPSIHYWWFLNFAWFLGLDEV